MQMEKGRGGLLATMARQQKLRIGAPTATEEAFFRDTVVLDDVISETEKELREAGQDLWQVKLVRSRFEGKGEEEEERRVENEVMNVVEAEEPRETDAAGGGVTWKAASRAKQLRGWIFWRVRGWLQPEGLAGGSKLHEQHWRFAEKEERGGTERIC